MDKSRPIEHYRPAKSWKPKPSNREELREIQKNRQSRFHEAILRRQECELPVHEVETEYSLGNPELPSFNHKEEIQEAVNNNQVTIIVGETGSGKSTQVPQFLMEAGYENITMTQPRIMAANGVAERIENELHMFGGLNTYDSAQSVGVHTSELNTVSRKEPAIKVVTDGLRLAQEFGDRGEIVDEVLIIDEVHEWNTNIEILVASAKKLIVERPSMRVVVMSATVKAHDLSNYFADAVGDIPPIVEIEGRTFPVEKIERPDSTVVNETIGSMDEDGDILVFVPGVGEINDTISDLRRRLAGTSHSDALIFPLHSKMPKREQDYVYIQPKDKKKIVVATGLAQTSITIPGITTVVDAGLERREEPNEDDDGSGLELHPTAQDTCTQRAGRAGRVEPGRYILTRLNDETEYIPFISRPEDSVPEILRTDITRNVLRLACDGQDFADFDFKHQVGIRKIEQAKEYLHALGAYETTEEDDNAVTEVGHYMNKFSLTASQARMMTEARNKSENIRKYMAAITASAGAGNLQSFIKGSEKKWKELTAGESSSDLVAQLNIFSEVYNAGFTSQHENDPAYLEFIKDYNLDGKNVKKALNEYERTAKRADVPPEVIYQEFEPPTSSELEEIYRCIYAGMAEMVYRKSGKEGFNNVYERAGSDKKTQRQVSDRSVVDKPGEWLVGMPYHHVRYQDGEKKTRHIIEGVTKIVDPADLASSSLKRLIKKVPSDLKWRDGQLRQIDELKLYDQSLGLTEERSPDFSKEVENEVLREVLAHSQRLSTVQKLFDLKKTTEELAQKDRTQSIEPLTQEDVIDILRNIIRKGEYTTVWEVENDLMVYDNIENKLSLEQVVDEEDITRITESSPDEIEIYGNTLDIIYIDGQPISRTSPDNIKRDIYLDDGREVLFKSKGKKRNRKSTHYVSGSMLNSD